MQDNKLAFQNWLSDKDTKKYSCFDCINCIEKTSSFAIENNFTTISFWLIRNNKAFNVIKSKLLNNRKYRYYIKEDFNLFLIAGGLYSRFLKDGVTDLGKDEQSTNIKTPQVRERTIAEAIVEVLKQRQPMFVREIYQEIVKQDLYCFGAIQPLGVVYNTLKCNCMDGSGDNNRLNKRFKVVVVEGKNKFALYDYEASPKEDLKDLKDKLDWDNLIAINFQNWIIQQGKAEATAKSYKGAMNYIVKTFSKEWAISQNQLTAIDGLKYFYNLIKMDENFLASNSKMHNAYSASIKAFYVFLKSQVDLKMQERQHAVENIWDWNGKNDFSDAKPIKIIINKEILVKSWKDVLRCIYEYATNNYSNIEIIGQHTSSEKLLSPYRLSNGSFIETQYSAKQIMAKCKRVLNLCGENLLNVKIIFQKKSEQHSNESNSGNKSVRYAIPNPVIQALRTNYPNGFKFDATAIRLLEDRVGVVIDNDIQEGMKKSMFHRQDDIYLLLESIASTETVEKIKNTADRFLAEYNAFELEVLYCLFDGQINKDCIRNLNDFEDFYDFIYGQKTRCINKYSTRIVRLQNKKSEEIIDSIVKSVYSIIREEGGVAYEWLVNEKICAFSGDFVASAIKECAEDIIKSKIGDIDSYRALDTLGLSQDFSEILSRVLRRTIDLSVEPTEDVLHALLTFEIGANFKDEYGIIENKIFRKLIAMYYKDTPKREWKGGIFMEVSE